MAEEATETAALAVRYGRIAAAITALPNESEAATRTDQASNLLKNATYSLHPTASSPR